MHLSPEDMFTPWLDLVVPKSVPRSVVFDPIRREFFITLQINRKLVKLTAKSSSPMRTILKALKHGFSSADYYYGS